MRATRASIIIVSVATVVFGASATAIAGTTTVHVGGGNIHHGTETFGDTVPCHPELGGYRITTTFNAQDHATANKNGFWITDTITGRFAASPYEFVTDKDGNLVRDENDNLIPVLDSNGNPIARSGETFTGHFTSWFGASINRKQSVATSTFSVHGVGSSGTVLSFHDVFHVVTLGPGDPFDPSTPLKNVFEHTHC